VAEPFRPLVAWGQRSQIWGSLGLTLFALLTVGVLLADVARHHNSASEAYRRDVVSTLNQAGLACPEPSVGLTFSEEIVEDVAKSNLFSYAEQYRTSSYVRTPLLKSSLYFSRIVSHHHAPILHFLGLDSLKWEIERREVREKPGGCIVNLKEQRAASPGRMPCGVLTLKDFFLEGK
jgi:hypothetical protein